MNKGLAVHVHHDILVEYCYDYKGRVEYIKANKPKEEQEIRLRLFKILPKKAEKDIPKGYLEANKALNEAYKAWDEAYKARNEAYKARNEADKAFSEANKAWSETDKDAFHAKWCGCKNWNGSKLVF